MTTTTRHVALLRGINVGKSGRVTMAALCAALRLDGIDVIATVVQSGNLVVAGFTGTPAQLGERIEASISTRLATSTRCLVRTESQIRRLLAADPLGRSNDDPAKYLAHLCDPPMTSVGWKKVVPDIVDPENSVHCQGTVVQWCPRGVSGEQTLSPLIERRTTSTVTARNWRTLGTLLERCASE
jgi:uncharacterized protein (DUF1697 family)